MTGGCRCGAVRFTADAAPLFVSHCHCASCRLAHAAPFVTWTAVPVVALQVTGAPTRFRSSPSVTRSFCGTCGTPLFYWGDDAPDRVYLPVAVVVGFGAAVEGHVSYEEHAPWIEGLERLPCAVGKGEARVTWR